MNVQEIVIEYEQQTGVYDIVVIHQNCRLKIKQNEPIKTVDKAIGAALRLKESHRDAVIKMKTKGA